MIYIIYGYFMIIVCISELSTASGDSAKSSNRSTALSGWRLPRQEMVDPPPHRGNPAAELSWVCLKIVYPIVPNGFADHYPY